MALSKNIQFTAQGSFNIVANNAYIRIDQISGGKNEILCHVNFYKSPDEQTSFKGDIYKFKPNLFGENFIAQAYAHLKTLPEFVGATDC
jgi:hypothetical protein